MYGHWGEVVRMKKNTKIKLLVCVCLIICLIKIYLSYDHENTTKRRVTDTVTQAGRSVVHPDTQAGRSVVHPDTVRRVRYLCPGCVHVCVVTCGDRAEEGSQVIKSTLLHRLDEHVWFHIFTDENSGPVLYTFLETIPENILKTFNYTLYNITYPAETVLGDGVDAWRKLFKLCATQRIFLPTVLPHVDSLLYLDTDVIVLESVQILWDYFRQFNATQLAAMTSEHESANSGWYNRFARHPYYGELGLNSGVMLMNLTRMRQTDYLRTIVESYHKYRQNITWGDQDLLNILFSIHPDWLYQLHCEWNYRPDYCIYGETCLHPDEKYRQQKALILHGNRGVFHNDKQPIFKSTYNIIKHTHFNTSRSEITQKLLMFHNKLYMLQCGQEHA